MARIPHLDLDRFRSIVGDDELSAIGGTGGWNTPEGRGIDEGRVLLAISFADQVVEGYLRWRYPSGSSHPILTNAASDIARYRLRSDLDGATVADEVRSRYKDALGMLRDIQSGRYALTDESGTILGEADGPTGSVMTSVEAGTLSPSRSAAVLEGWL